VRKRWPPRWLLSHRRSRGHWSDDVGREPTLSADGVSKRLCSELVDDCSAFLLAHLVDRLEQKHQSVPVWAWTNLLAHGTEQDLRGAQSVSGRRLIFDRQWHLARSYLAVEILALAQRCGPLADLQRDVLIPLELQLASRPEVARWSPRQWVTNVEAALNEHDRG